MVTIETLEKYNVYEAIEFVKKLEPEYKPRPRKPFLSSNAISSEVEKYAVLLKQFELDIADYENLQQSNRELCRDLNSVLEEYIKKEAGLFETVPEDKQSKVWNYAWQQGHSSGYTEIYNYLLDIVELFE